MRPETESQNRDHELWNHEMQASLPCRMNGTQFWCFPWFPANSLLCIILRYTVYNYEINYTFLKHFFEFLNFLIQNVADKQRVFSRIVHPWDGLFKAMSLLTFMIRIRSKTHHWISYLWIVNKLKSTIKYVLNSTF